MAKAKVNPADPQQDILHQVFEAERSVNAQFTDIWTEAKSNADIFKLKHWTDAEEGKIAKQNRIPWVFDRLSHPMNVLLGTQRSTRFDIYFYPRRDSDEQRTEILNATWKYFSDVGDYIHIESDVFQDGIISKYGVFGIEIDRRKDLRGNLLVRRWPYDQVMWDLNARQYDLSDAQWMSVIEYVPRFDVLARYSDSKAKQDLIKSAGLDTTWATNNKIKIQYWYKPNRDLLGLRTFYERDYVTKFFIWQKGTEEPEDAPYLTKKDAESEIKSRIAILDQARTSASATDPSALSVSLPEFQVLPVEVQTIFRTKVMINGVLEDRKRFEMDEWPITVYFPYFNDGDFWSAVDRLKDPQKFLNRMYQQVDYAIGTSAKGALRVDPLVPKAAKDKILGNWGKTGFAFEAKQGQVELIEGRGVQPQLFSVIDRVEANLHESLGGANFEGLPQGASESGRAVLARQAQAGLDTFVPLDNLHRSKQNLGEKLVWFLVNEITEPRKLRITGEPSELQSLVQGNVATPSRNPNAAFIEINTKQENTIKDLEVDVVVDQTAYSTTRNMAILASLTDAAKSGLLTAPIPPQVVIQMLDLPQSLKQSWIQSLQSQAGENKQPPAKPVNINFKDIPPQAQAEALNSIGLPATEQATLLKQIIDRPHLTQPEQQASGAPS